MKMSETFKKGDLLILKKRFISVIKKVPDEDVGVFIVLKYFPYSGDYHLMGMDTKIIICKLNQSVHSYHDFFGPKGTQHFFYDAVELKEQ